MIPITFKRSEGEVAFSTKSVHIPTIGSVITWPENEMGMYVKAVEYHYEGRFLMGPALASITVWLVKGTP